MGRIKFAVLSVTCLALLGLSLPVIAQESSQSPQKSSSSGGTKTKGSLWKQIRDGIWEARIPKFSDDEPEFAVLRLSADAFAEFQKDKVAFLNKYKVFNKDINKLALYSEAKPKNEDPPNSYNYVSLAHWPTSTAAAQVYQGWSEPAGGD